MKQKSSEGCGGSVVKCEELRCAGGAVRGARGGKGAREIVVGGMLL